MMPDVTDARLWGIAARGAVRGAAIRVAGDGCGIGEDEVLERLRRLKAEKIIRQISAIFDTRSLGYASSLVAARVAPEWWTRRRKSWGVIPG